MKQMLHIFRRDVRRLWIEILLSVVIAALFAWVTPRSWLGDDPMSVVSRYRPIDSVVVLLLLLSWGLLIARLIHGEVLVGDRQFWITRPYEWPKLLAAKMLFVALFLYVPYLLMEVAILVQAGFNPLAYIAGLLYRLLLISLVFFPLIALATVTSNLVRMVLTLLAILVAFIAAASAFAFHFEGRHDDVTFTLIPNGGLAAIVVALLICGAVVVWQYARRRALVARMLLGSTPFLVLLTSWMCNTGLSVDMHYPRAAQTDASVIRMIAFEQDGASRAAAQNLGVSGNGEFNQVDTKKWAVIQVRLRASGVAAGDRWQLDGFRPILTPATGAPLKLDWQRGENVFDRPDDAKALNYVMLAFLVPRADYERMKSSALTLHLDFAFTQARPARYWQIPLEEGGFMIPDLASCSTIGDRPGASPHISQVICRFPLRMPALTTVAAMETKGQCPAAPAAAGDTAAFTSQTLGNFNSAPADLGISPMDEWGILSAPNSNISFVNGKMVMDTQSPRLCPGTRVVVTQYRKVRALQTGLTIENFSLAGQ